MERARRGTGGCFAHSSVNSTNLRHPTLTNPPPHPPLAAPPSPRTGTPELFSACRLTSKQQQRWRPKPLPLSWTSKLSGSLRAPPSQLHTDYDYSGTGYSKLGMTNHHHYQLWASSNQVCFQVSPATIPLPSSSLPQSQPRAPQAALAAPGLGALRSQTSPPF